MIYEDKDRKLWELVCHVPEGPSGTAHAVLRGQDGQTRLFPAADLGGADKPLRALVAGEPFQPGDEVVKETLHNIRHVSTVRFLALPIFFTSMGVLAREYFSNTPVADVALIPHLGLGLAVGFIVFETVLSRNLITWWKAIRAAGARWAVTTAHRNRVAVWAARLALFAPYPAGAAYWLGHSPYSLTGSFWADASIMALPSILVWAVGSRPTTG